MNKNSPMYQLKHLVDSTANTLRGIFQAIKCETSFRQELAVLVILMVAGPLYGLSLGAMLAVLLCWLLVMSLELLNVGIEAVCNLVSTDFHPLIKVAKDAGSAAVGVAIFGNALLWAYMAYTFW